MALICTLLLAVVFAAGFVDLLRVFRFWLLRPMETPPIVVELRLESEQECEYQLWAVQERLRWLRLPKTLQVRCCNPTGSAFIEAAVKKFAARYPCFVYERLKDESFSCRPAEGRG